MKISIRNWEIEDAPALMKAINNKNVLDNLRDGIPFPYTVKDAEEFISATLAAEKDTQYAFAITYDGEVIGSIGVFRKENIQRLSAALGYFIAETYWGIGIMTEAVRQICSYVFEHTDIVRIFTEPYSFNTASCRVLEKAGFQFEGTMRQSVLKSGRLVDVKMYALIKRPVIRPLITEDIASAMELVWRVFAEFEAPEYSEEGIAKFMKIIDFNFIADKIKSGEFRLWGAFDKDKIIGVIATKPPLHIFLLFVDKEYHRRGIARELVQTVINDLTVIHGHDSITVNSPPNVVEIYKRLGFVPTEEEQTENGMRYTPMEYLFIKIFKKSYRGF